MSVIRAAARPGVRFVRRAWERVLHPWRRQRARALLRRHRMPSVVLFVCHGNICRSPYAEGALRARLGTGAASVIQVRSVGFIGPDRPSPRFAIEEAAARGVDLRHHRASTISLHDVRTAEVVCVMEPAQKDAVRQRFPTAGTIVVLGDLDPVNNGARIIIDPVDKPRPVFAASYDRIDRCVAVLAAIVAG